MKTPRFSILRNLAVPGTIMIVMVVVFALCRPSCAEPLTLQDALKIAMENNPVIKSVKADAASLKSARQITEAENNLSASVNDFFGSKNMTGMISSSSPTGVMPSTIMLLPKDDWNSANFSLMYPLYTGGRAQAEVKSASFKETAAAKDVARMENELAFLVKVKYFEALFKEKEINAYGRLVELEKENLNISENLYGAGKIPFFYYLRAKNELAKALQELNNKITEKEVSLSEFKKLLGKEQNFEVNFADSLVLAVFEWTLPECVKQAAGQRPDLKIIEDKLNSAREEIKRANGFFMPQVYLMGMYDYKNNVDHGYSAGLVGSLPIIDSGARKFKVEKAQKEYEKMLALKKDMELSVEQEVTAAYQKFKTAKENAALSGAAVAEAEEVYKIAKLKYEERKGIYVETLDALLNLTSAYTRKYEAIFKNNAAAAELYFRMGIK